MKRKRKVALWLLAAVVTVWQYFGGLARCGGIDGGILLAPTIALTVALVRGVRADLRQAFGSHEDQRESERAVAAIRADFWIA